MKLQKITWGQGKTTKEDLKPINALNWWLNLRPLYINDVPYIFPHGLVFMRKIIAGLAE